MKRIVSLALVLMMVLTCVVSFASCDLGKKRQEKKMLGTYEMVSISGTISYNGETIQLEKDLYEYYRIILEKDGVVTIEAKGTNGAATEEEGEWEWDTDDEVLKVWTKPEGSPVRVLEKMEWEDDTITYTANQTVEGMTISMTIVLEKVAD